MSICLRCGKCCYSLKGNKCPHLILLPSGKTLCRVYKTRLGRSTRDGEICKLRKDVKRNYPGCPFNKL